MVPGEGLEPSRPKSSDFESDVYTNFTIQADLSKKHFILLIEKVKKISKITKNEYIYIIKIN